MCFFWNKKKFNIIVATKNMMEAYDRKRDYNLSMAIATKILKCDSQNLDALYYRGSSYYTLKNYKAAKKDFDNFLSKIPNNPHVRLLHGSCCMELANNITKHSKKTKKTIINILEITEIAIKDFNTIIAVIDTAKDDEFGFKIDGKRKTKSEAEVEAKEYLNYAKGIKEMANNSLGREFKFRKSLK